MVCTLGLTQMCKTHGFHRIMIYIVCVFRIELLVYRRVIMGI